MKQIIGKSATNNVLFIRFELILGTSSHITSRMSYRIINRTFVPWIMNICVTSVRQWLRIRKVDNVVIELWAFTCMVAG